MAPRAALLYPAVVPTLLCVFVPCVTRLCFHRTTQAKEQYTGRIIDTLNRCIGLLPRDKLQHVSSIGLSGQMHGVVFWKGKGGKTTSTTCLPAPYTVRAFHNMCVVNWATTAVIQVWSEQQLNGSAHLLARLKCKTNQRGSSKA